jgi:hypothetical protein
MSSRVYRFWNAVDRPLRKGKKGETLEPRGVIGEYIEPPKDLISKSDYIELGVLLMCQSVG